MSNRSEAIKRLIRSAENLPTRGSNQPDRDLLGENFMINAVQTLIEGGYKLDETLRLTVAQIPIIADHIKIRENDGRDPLIRALAAELAEGRQIAALDAAELAAGLAASLRGGSATGIDTTGLEELSRRLEEDAGMRRPGKVGTVRPTSQATPKTVQRHLQPKAAWAELFELLDWRVIQPEQRKGVDFLCAGPRYGACIGVLNFDDIAVIARSEPMLLSSTVARMRSDGTDGAILLLGTRPIIRQSDERCEVLLGMGLAHGRRFGPRYLRPVFWEPETDLMDLLEKAVGDAPSAGSEGSHLGTGHVLGFRMLLEQAGFRSDEKEPVT